MSQSVLNVCVYVCALIGHVLNNGERFCVCACVCSGISCALKCSEPFV